mgnify:CR=1 FL=1|jgi:hypothetical protein
MSNPFTPTFGVSPAILAGREDLISDFRLALAEGLGNPFRAIIISGSKGVGKTVLVNEFEDIAAEQGWLTIRAYPSADMISTLVQTTIPEAIELVAQQGNTKVLTGASISGIDSVSFTTDPNYEKPVRTLITQLRRLSQLIADPAGILITLDELQGADPDLMHELGTAVQDLMRDRHDVAFVAAGLPIGVDELLQNEGTTFLRRAVRIELNEVDAEDAGAMFTETARIGGRTMTESAVEKAVEISRGYPYLMQIIGSLAWAQANLDKTDTISGDTVEKIRDKAITRLGLQVHKPSLHNLPPRELEILQVMAKLTDADGPVRTADIATELGVEPNRISMARSSLLNKAIIHVPERGALSFSLPYLGQYLRDLNL